ncbi:ABC-2 type transport system permease protein [Fontibacillus phaseoli]|uniref:ABC-2 type transport system permease protein n=1 Tax=Fontibacillus phaseoli TaxID=1416533 RepID=A0A369BH55_9BACL|nr:ABC-2 family transporter protein [Fontibacillus phaseoli]RCX20595.1 ABC-2 type transport system permease protein [Fontibacillus phaseoli]
MRRYARLYWQYFKTRIKVMMEYRIDFLIGVASVFFTQGTSILFIAIVFQHIDTIHGWTFQQMLFIYAIAMLGRSLEHTFFDNLWTLGWQYIRPGNFDRVLIRPVNPLFQVVAERVQQDGIGSFIIGLIVLFTSAPSLGLEWGAAEILMLIVMVISSGAIYMAVNLFFATLSFWMVDSLPVMYAVQQTSDFARYPMNIFGKGIRFVLTFIIPYGFTAFYPAAWFLEDSGYRHTAVWTPVVAFLSVAIAYLFWKRGLRSFTGTGS